MSYHKLSHYARVLSDSKTAYLVGLSRFSLNFGTFAFRPTRDRQSSFMTNYNFLTQFNINWEIESYIDLISLSKVNFQLQDSRNRKNWAKYPLRSQWARFWAAKPRLAGWATQAKEVSGCRRDTWHNEAWERVFRRLSFFFVWPIQNLFVFHFRELCITFKFISFLCLNIFYKI